MNSTIESDLLYHGKPMKFAPTRVLCLQSFGPLASDEPADADIFRLLSDGYSVFVELQPGDGTRYGLLLTSGANGINAMRVGSPSDGSVGVTVDKTLTTDDCRALAPGNLVSRVFFAWWLNRLRQEGM
jgi:hypothetical protein